MLQPSKPKKSVTFCNIWPDLEASNPYWKDLLKSLILPTSVKFKTDSGDHLRLFTTRLLIDGVNARQLGGSKFLAEIGRAHV